LTSRERELLPLLVSGLLNKQAAFQMGITEYTVQVHRGHIMRKMQADSFAGLVRMADKLNPRHQESRRRSAAPAIKTMRGRFLSASRE
jgi:DNA-binding NarL/FixJ family response regulator